MNTPRQYALVKVVEIMKIWLTENGHKDSPLLEEDVFVFLGEIPNMPEHCVISGYKSGKILSGHHTSNFIELAEGEM